MAPTPTKATLTKKGPFRAIRCRCGDVATIGLYPIAQMAMGHAVTHICSKCGWRADVASAGPRSYQIVLQRAPTSL